MTAKFPLPTERTGTPNGVPVPFFGPEKPEF